MQDLRIQRVKVLMMLYTSNYFVKVRQKQLLDHTYALSRDQAFDYMTEFNKRLSDKVGIKCTMDILLPTDDDNANIIIEHNGIIKKLMKEADKLELDTDAIKVMMRDLLDELKADSDKTYILVAHNGIARIVCSYFKDMTNDEFAAYGVANCSITEFEF